MRRSVHLCPARLTVRLFAPFLASLLLQGCLTAKVLKRAHEPDVHKVSVGDVENAAFEAGKKEFVLCILEYPDGASASSVLRYTLKLPEELIMTEVAPNL